MPGAKLIIGEIAHLLHFCDAIALASPGARPACGWCAAGVSRRAPYLAIAQMPNLSVRLIGTFIGVSRIFAASRESRSRARSAS